MNIVFVVGSLIPGRDAVGDYTLKLALQLRDLQCEVGLLAINDKSPTYPDELHLLTEAGVTILRLSSHCNWSDRVDAAKAFITDSNPRILSLQYVPFAYHSKGMSLRLHTDLMAIGGRCPWQVMCHELWIEKTFPVAFRHKLLGKIQKPLVRHLFKSLKPVVVHTHLAYYQRMLGSMGVDSKLLPLHGNIRLSSSRAEAREWLCSRVRSNGDEFMAGFFGNILTTMNIDAAYEFAKSAAVGGRKLHVLSAGGLDAGGEHLWRAIATKLNAAAKFTLLGPLSEQEVSKYLSGLDLGLTSYPAELAGKSGGVASMLEHGVRVLCLGRLHGQSAAGHSSFIETASASSVALTATRFLNDIAEASVQTF